LVDPIASLLFWNYSTSKRSFCCWWQYLVCVRQPVNLIRD
jgi:hypothetical protein